MMCSEKIHISFFKLVFLSVCNYFVMYVCISKNKIVFKPIMCSEPSAALTRKNLVYSRIEKLFMAC